LGESLGINLLPVNRKVCNFNCIYCECGLTPKVDLPVVYPEPEEVYELLDARLREMKMKNEYLNSITFAGNGEPTLHPDFPRIIGDAIKIRDRLFPDVNIAVLSNATRIGDKRVFDALLKADLNILKLDSVFAETLSLINCPLVSFKLPELLKSMKLFRGKMIIQTLFLKGIRDGKMVDNTSEKEVSAWISVLNDLKPESAMIYSLARDTAVNGLEGIGAGELQAIADRCEKAGIKVQVTP
jgi:wyosine [tRNA(Phe)-imidazoG37] synthetase (radical SAM superfamily)